MRRRDFLGVLSGAGAWPFAAYAQTPSQVRRVGMVAGASEKALHLAMIALREELMKLGWSKDRNLILDLHFAAGNYQRLLEGADALIKSHSDVIIAQGGPAVSAVRQRTSNIPIVFTHVADPVALGIVKSLSRPGGHMTGFTNYEFSIGGKWLDLLRELQPQLKHVALISNPANENSASFSEFIELAAKSVVVAVARASARNATEIEVAISTAAQKPGGALIFFPDALPLNHRDFIIQLAERYRLPAIYPFREFPMNGGLISYGLEFPAVFRQAAGYVDRILRGSKPADLPVQAPTKFEMVMNLKTAKALGLTVPPTLLARADEVIE